MLSLAGSFVGSLVETLCRELWRELWRDLWKELWRVRSIGTVKSTASASTGSPEQDNESGHFITKVRLYLTRTPNAIIRCRQLCDTSLHFRRVPPLGPLPIQHGSSELQSISGSPPSGVAS